MRTIAFIAIALWAGAAQAAVIHIKPSLITVFDSQFNDVTETVDVNENGQVRLRPNAAPYIMQVDLSFTINDLDEGQLGFGNAAFNINLGGALMQATVAPGWNPHNEFIGPDPFSQVSLFADNGDYGVPGDLQSIVVGIDPNDFRTTFFDKRRVLGRNRDEYFGRVFFELPGNLDTMGRLSIQGDGGSVYDVSNKLVADGVMVIGGSIEFQVVPEPSSASLIGLGGVLLAVIGRRWHANSSSQCAFDVPVGPQR